MTPHSTETNPTRIAFAPLRPKRRCKIEEKETPTPEPVHEPVLLNARAELRRNRNRITRSGRPNVTWRRVTSPIQLSEFIPVPVKTRPPVMARVIDKVKTAQRLTATAHPNGVWGWLRCWALAFR